EAAALAESGFAAHPKSAVLATALGEVRYRQGRLHDAFESYRTAVALDVCVARTHYDLARLLRAESMFGFAYSQLQTAHALEPDDPDIHLAWIYTLPLAERARQLGVYLAAAKDQSTRRRQSMKLDESRLHAILAGKKAKRGCRLAATSPTTTKLNFTYIERDEAGRYHSIGLAVKVNSKAWAQLKLDTGASGILLDRGTAKKAGLVPVAADTISGIGDQKGMDGYWAYADDFRIGRLEFKDCMVEVSDKRSVAGIDGLIGADVFENYHVRLDFPLRQMDLSPLPARPGQAQKHGLNASGIGSAAPASGPTKKSSTAAVQPVVRYHDRYVAPEMKSW
ncbi:MAG TPA: aspartyl protease family protein, partial [Pirellulales bacterium]